MISLGIFKDSTNLGNLLLVKHYLYAIKNDGNSCTFKLEEINGFQSEVFPLNAEMELVFILYVLSILIKI